MGRNAVAASWLGSFEPTVTPPLVSSGLGRWGEGGWSRRQGPGCSDLTGENVQSRIVLLVQACPWLQDMQGLMRMTCLGTWWFGSADLLPFISLQLPNGPWPPSLPLSLSRHRCPVPPAPRSRLESDVRKKITWGSFRQQ